MKNVLKFTTILFELITLSALMAHLLAFPAKMKLTQEDYYTVQRIYSGWAWLGIFEVGALLLTLIWSVSERKKKGTFLLLIIAFIFFAVSLTLFFIFTFPSNTVTVNWTFKTDNWQMLRQRWEYSHAARTMLNLIGFSCLILSLLKNKN
jgi:hypothetical protein